jgi:hypothetical protein
VLRDVALRPEAFEHVALPLKLRQGRVGALRIQVCMLQEGGWVEQFSGGAKAGQPTNHQLHLKLEEHARCSVCQCLNRAKRAGEGSP